jgi:hypothetical protein
MNKTWASVACGILLLIAGALHSRAVELRVSRDALENTLKQQLFSGPGGRFYLKGTPQSACSVYVDDATVAFIQDRIVVKVKTRANMGKSVGGSCVGISLLTTAPTSTWPLTAKAKPSASAMLSCSR